MDEALMFIFGILFVSALILFGSSLGYYSAIESTNDHGWQYACSRSMWTSPEYCLGKKEAE